MLDVDLYDHRLTLLDMLTAAYPLPPGFLDPMAGIRIQTAWQVSSGRANNAWWSKVNYTLTVWRMQALQSRGEFARVVLQGNLQVPLPDSVGQGILAYYDVVRTVDAADQAVESRLQTLFWSAHEQAVAIAMQAAVGQVPSLPPGEREFALGWGKVMVKVLSDVDFSTDKRFIGPLNTSLFPQRICRDEDTDPLALSDLPPAQRTTVLLIADLYRASDLSPIYTPVLDTGAAALDDAIASRVDLDRKLGELRQHLRPLAGTAAPTK